MPQKLLSLLFVTFLLNACLVIDPEEAAQYLSASNDGSDACSSCDFTPQDSIDLIRTGIHLDDNTVDDWGAIPVASDDPWDSWAEEHTDIDELAVAQTELYFAIRLSVNDFANIQLPLAQGYDRTGFVLGMGIHNQDGCTDNGYIAERTLYINEDPDNQEPLKVFYYVESDFSAYLDYQIVGSDIEIYLPKSSLPIETESFHLGSSSYLENHQVNGWTELDEGPAHCFDVSLSDLQIQTSGLIADINTDGAAIDWQGKGILVQDDTPDTHLTATTDIEYFKVALASDYSRWYVLWKQKDFQREHSPSFAASTYEVQINLSTDANCQEWYATHRMHFGQDDNFDAFYAGEYDTAAANNGGWFEYSAFSGEGTTVRTFDLLFDQQVGSNFAELSFVTDTPIAGYDFSLVQSVDFVAWTRVVDEFGNVIERDREGYNHCTRLP